MSEQLTGHVKWYDYKKGFGFIKIDDAEFFAHYSQIQEGDVLREGDKVTFDEAETEKGKQAHNIKKVL